MLRASLTKTIMAAGLLMATGAQAVELHDTGGSITGSVCIGAQCTGAEAFGQDTLRLKDDNTRIHFDDTSAQPDFPSNDWRLVANDIFQHGFSYFALEDTTAGTTPIRVEAGAQDHALYLDDAGRVGLGTSMPQAELHVSTPLEPTIRLEQTAVGDISGTPYNWRILGNDGMFGITDRLYCCILPFLIERESPSYSLVIDHTGNIGLGTFEPTAGLHVVRAAAAPAGLLRLTNDDVVYMTLEDTSPGGETWNIQSHDGEFRFTNATGPGIELAMSVGGDLRISGELTTAGSCSVGCDAVFTDDYEIMPIAERAELMWANGYLPNVGPTPEDGPFNVSDKMGRMLNELEHAHIYIAQMNAEMAAMKASHAAQIAELHARFDALEHQSSN